MFDTPDQSPQHNRAICNTPWRPNDSAKTRRIDRERVRRRVSRSALLICLTAFTSAKVGLNDLAPATLTDHGVVQKIKKDLIHKAKVKKEYAKLKAREDGTTSRSVYDREDDRDAADTPTEPTPEPTLDPHPDRVKMLEEPSRELEPQSEQFERAERRKREKRPRPEPFKKEAEVARKNEQEAEARRKAREEAEKERARKIAERERFRKVMAKARKGGPNGQRKLGKESTVLLEKAKRIMGKT
jgi:hypothetical protein